MNKLSIFAVTMFAVLFASCEEKEIKIYPSMEYSTTALVHGTGTYNEQPNISVADLFSEIEDLDIDGEVTDVMIEGVYIKYTNNGVIGYPNSTATKATANLSITSWEGVETIVANNITIDLAKGNQDINLREYLNKNGIKKLKEMALQVAENSVPNSNGIIKVKLSGTSIPSDGYVNAKIEIVIKLAFEYTKQIDAIF